MSKTEYLIGQYYTSLQKVTYLLVRNGSWRITLTSSTTLLAIIKAKEHCGKRYWYYRYFWSEISISAKSISTHLYC